MNSLQFGITGTGLDSRSAGSIQPTGRADIQAGVSIHSKSIFSFFRYSTDMSVVRIPATMKIMLKKAAKRSAMTVPPKEGFASMLTRTIGRSSNRPVTLKYPKMNLLLLLRNKSSTSTAKARPVKRISGMTEVKLIFKLSKGIS